MDSRSYNNPLFAQGLGSLMDSYFNSERRSSNDLNASQALLNNQTALYREAIGDTGLNGDLSSMMIRALQAGPQYSGNAPKIGRAALEMGSLGFGPEQLTPTGPLAAAFRGNLSSGGRRRGSGGSGGSTPKAAPKLTQGELNRATAAIKLIPDLQEADRNTVLNAAIDLHGQGGFVTLDQAVAAVVESGINYVDAKVGVDQNDSWINPVDWFTGPTDIMEPRLQIGSPTTPEAPVVSAPDAAIQHLRANPDLAADFDKKYGPGTAAAILGG